MIPIPFLPKWNLWHEEIYFDDGSSTGFLGDNNFGAYSPNSEIEIKGLNDILLIASVNACRSQWDPHYSAFFHNCHHFVDQVIRIYRSLEHMPDLAGPGPRYS